MLLLAVCDDMPIECAKTAKQIESILNRANIDYVIKTFFTAQELLRSKESFDILFLDVKMPEINGMELAKNMRKQGIESIIVFITSAKEYVFDAYDVEAFQYLMKPVETDKLKTVMEKAVKKLQGKVNEDFLIITAERQTRKILLRDIFYIESLGRIVKIHCVNGIQETYEQISALENKLAGKSFFRCHKCYLVHLEYVDTFNRTDITLDNGETILLAKRRCEEFKKAILSYMKRKGGII